VSGRKLAGILAEGHADTVVARLLASTSSSTAFPPELRSRATSLESEIGRRIESDLVLDETLAALSRRYEDLLAGRFDAILDAWRRPRARRVRARASSWTTMDGAQSGVTAGHRRPGALLVQMGDRVSASSPGRHVV
jgi:biotin-(acetyl-CoA carboxylase) ligase